MDERDIDLIKRQKRKKRIRRIKIKAVVSTLVIVAILLVATYMVRKSLSLGQIEGSWTREVDVTDQVACETAIWLSDVGGMDTSQEWIHEKLGSLTYTSVLTFEKTGLGKGEFSEVVDKESYEACKDDTYRAVARCLEDIIARRLDMAGYGEELSEEDAKKVVSEVLGVSTEQYLKEKGVDMLPAIEVEEGINNRSGAYSLSGSSITWTCTSDVHGDKPEEINENGQVTESISFVDDMLVIPEDSRVYRRVK